MSAIGPRFQTRNKSASMRVELGIAGPNQVGSDVQPSWPRGRMRLQESVMISFRVVRVWFGEGCCGTIRIQQIVQPLDHDSSWKICQRNKFSWRNVAIRVKRRLQRTFAKGRGIRSSEQAFVSTHGIGNTAGADDSGA